MYGGLRCIHGTSSGMLEYYLIKKEPVAYVASCMYLGALVCLVPLMHFLIAY